MYKVKVKWGKETYADVDLDTSESPMVFRAQLYALTGVNPERQKIMVKGATVKPDSWEGIRCKDGTMVLMMGSKDEDVPSEPVDKPTFIEDMTEAELNSVLELPVGIKNLGNTCYLNAVLQCLKSVPEIQEAVINFDLKSDRSTVAGPMLTAAIQDVFHFMDLGKTAIPIVFVDLFRTTFPRFAEQGEGGKYMQQDASECWTELIHLFQEVFPAKGKENLNEKFNSSVIDQYFSGEFHCEWSCDECEEEKTETYDRFQQLSCHISQDIKYLHTGLVARLKEDITKRSEKLDRDAVFTKKSMITRLPAYLTVEMVRFFYKEKEKVNAKILKDVKFPIILDVMELCSPELQKKLLPIRDKYKEMEERQKEEDKLLKRGRPIHPSEKIKTKKLSSFFSDDMGSNNSGFYELKAVLTHQGRSSSSGHYLAWVNFRGKEWLKCDDEDITPVSEEEILKLSGGGDWHTAYILLYGPRVLEVPVDEIPLTSSDENASDKKEAMDVN